MFTLLSGHLTLRSLGHDGEEQEQYQQPFGNACARIDPRPAALDVQVGPGVGVATPAAAATAAGRRTCASLFVG